MNNKIIIMLFAFMFPITCFAERLLPVDFIGQPFMNLREGVIQSCGVRFVGYQTPANLSNPKENLWFSDASFMFDRSGAGMVKAILSKITVDGVYKNKKPDIQTYKTFWIKVAGTDATKPIKGNAIVGETKGSKIYATDGIGVMKIYTAFVSNEPIQIGYKFNDDSNDFALYGKISLSDDEFKQINSCMNELLEKMQHDGGKSEQQ